MDSILTSLKPFAEVAQAVSALVAACTFLIGAGTLWKSIAEYRRGNSLKRFEKFQEMRGRFERAGAVKDVTVLLIEDDEDLACLDYRKKEDFLGFFEEIAIMNQSGLLSDGITHYMFGYYALRAFRSANFRRNVNLDSPYWTLFRSLCERLEVQERYMNSDKNRLSVETKKLRF